MASPALFSIPNDRVLDSLRPLYHEFRAKTARNQKILFVVLSRQKSKNKRKLVLKFSKKDFEKMTNKYRNIFALGNKIVSYRQKKNGVYEARYHRNGIDVEVSSKDLNVLKQKFIAALNNLASTGNVKDRSCYTVSLLMFFIFPS